MTKSLELKLDEIAGSVFDRIERKDHFPSYGLYDSKFGILLFLYYYSKYTNKIEDIYKADSFAEELLAKAFSNNQTYTFCSGNAGILYLVKFLKEESFIDIDITEAELGLDNYLISSMRKDLQNGNYDFLHGALGVGLYFLKTGKHTERIAEIIDFLYSTAEKDTVNQVFKWKSIISLEEKEMGYNISLSHGMSSIILFLCRVIDSGYKEKNKVLEILNGTVNYVLSQEIDENVYGSHFPSHSLDNNKPVTASRLAWCYGDMGVAYALWYAGKTTKNINLQNKGLNILLDSTKRRESQNTNIIDAGICHGSVGLVMMYRHMYIETHDEIFQEAINHWIEVTLSFSKFEDGLAGYKAYRASGWENDEGLLTGISGIGLVFTSILKDDAQSWDEMFLL
ncbi:MAG: lanthionine synthetase C family protein [Paludibacteraceae bacterium]